VQEIMLGRVIVAIGSLQEESQGGAYQQMGEALYEQLYAVGRRARAKGPSVQRSVAKQR